MLNTNSYVIIIANDFCKAFNIVRHVTLLEKLCALDLTTSITDWSTFFSGRTQCTTFYDATSVLQEISASIVQGSAVGPASYVVSASDPKFVNAGNALCKYADDTYIIIPSRNVDTRTEEKVPAGVAVSTTRCHKSTSAEGPWCDN